MEGSAGRSPVRRRRTTRAKLVCFGGAETGCACSLAFRKIRKGKKAIPAPFCKFRFPAA